MKHYLQALLLDLLGNSQSEIQMGFTAKLLTGKRTDIGRELADNVSSMRK